MAVLGFSASILARSSLKCCVFYFGSQSTSLLVAAKQEATNEKRGQFWSLKKWSGDQDQAGELKHIRNR